MKINFHIIYVLIIGVLALLLLKPFAKSDKVNEFGGSIADTLSFKRDTNINLVIDTLRQDNTKEKIIYKEKVVKDTIYIRDTIKMPIVQKYFSVPNKYDLWISGIEPLNIDKINVYNQIEYKTITNTITRDVYRRNMQVYFGGGFYSFNGEIFPIIGTTIKTKKDMLISLNLGHYKSGSMLLLDIKFKILGK